MRIRVPATSANLGPGFDSCGIALNRYLFVEVLEDSDTWQIEHDLPGIPTDENNLLLKTALSIAPELTPKMIKMTSDIPMTRGLGSSSSVIVAGIELANRLGQLNLSEKEKIELANQIEGHPDNIAPAICGDFVIATSLADEVAYVKHYFPEADFLAFIPAGELATEKSREVLPQELSFKTAVQASGVANVMIAAIAKGDLTLAGKMMEEDLLHEDYRQDLIPHLATLRQISHEEGGYGCYLSGAGSTVIIVSPENRSTRIMQLLRSLDPKAAVELLQIDREGVQVF